MSLLVLKANNTVQSSSESESFAKRIVAWQRVSGRHGLPWQSDRTAYRVWLSEVMLQQTQVITVLPYFERFLNAFPSVQSLAQAPAEQVMALWSGLGYYSRARNLHRCAQQVVSEHCGQFPIERAGLEALPGIGRSTAAAIRVFAHGQRDAILDGNVKRVFCRHFAVEGVPDTPATLRQLWPLAEHELPQTDLVAYTQGLMDLGATVCTRNRPNCSGCPVSETCQAFQTDQVAQLPTRRKKKSLPQRETTIVLAIDAEQQVLVEQRPDSGIWGGLLSLPESDLQADTEIETLLGNAGLSAHVVVDAADASNASQLPPIDHIFTHFKLRLHPVMVRVKFRASQVQEAGLRPLPLGAAAQSALPRPIKALLEAVAAQSDDLWTGQ